jgi:phage baseplate assembly protein gpV
MMSRLYDTLIDHIMQRVEGRIDAMARPRFATVTSYNPADHTAKLTIQPEGTQTGWVPMPSGTAGGGGAVSGPAIGQQVMTIPQDGFAEHPVVVAAYHSDENPPPQGQTAINTGGGAPTLTPTQSQEHMIVIPGGAQFRMMTDGSFMLVGTLNLQGPMNIHGNVTITGGNLVVSQGDVSDKHGSLDRLRGNYNTHIGHSGGGGVPNKQDPE